MKMKSHIIDWIGICLTLLLGISFSLTIASSVLNISLLNIYAYKSLGVISSIFIMYFTFLFVEALYKIMVNYEK
jgi:hypothetical protein